MKRRSFNHWVTLASAGLVTLSIASCTSSAKKDENSNSDKDSDTTFELEEETIEGLGKKLILQRIYLEQLEMYLNVLKT
jgi:hypothetical protein